MPSGIETPALGIDPSVDPVVLAVMFVAFLIGAVGPFAVCVVGSVREERAMRRHAALINAGQTAPPAVANAAERAAPSPTAVLQPAGAPAIPSAANDTAGTARAAGG